MQNIADMYNKELEEVKYTDSYDIRIHGVQTALCVMDYNSNKFVNSNEIIFGYYCVNTEEMIKAFQIKNKILQNGILNKTTWNMIFSNLLKNYMLVVIKTGINQITLFDLVKYLDEINKENNNDINIENNNQYPNDFIENNNYYNNNLYGDYNENFNKNINNYLDEDNKDDKQTDLSGLSLYYKYLDYLKTGNNSFLFDNIKDPNGNTSFNEIIYNTLKGGKTFEVPKYSYNIGGSLSYEEKQYTQADGSSNRDYNYIYNLLANSIYNVNLEKNLRNSTSDMYKNYNGNFKENGNKPYFNKNNIDILKRQKFDIVIQYGQDGNYAKKILQVTPISVTQQVNASGEPICDVFEFVAKDYLDCN